MISWGPRTYGIKEVIIPDIAVLSQEDKDSIKTRLIAVDVENNPKTMEFVSVGIYAGLDKTYYITGLSKELEQLLNSTRIIGHNFKSDLHKFKYWGININLNNWYCDTMTMLHSINSTKKKYNLKDTAEEYLNIKWPKYSDLQIENNNSHIHDWPLEVQAAYNGMDCIATYKHFLNWLGKTDWLHKQIFFNIDMPLERLLFEMEEKGVLVDLPYLKQLDIKISKEVEEKKQELQTMVGPIKVPRKKAGKNIVEIVQKFNPNSSVQKKLAGHKLGIPLEGSDKKKHLDQFKLEPFVNKLLEFNKIKDVWIKYITKIPQLAIKSLDGALRTEFKQNTITYRLSSSGPNLQNQPSKGELGTMMRKVFIPRPGCVFVCADYSQIDLRALAHYSQEPAWINEFKKSDGDPHQGTVNVVQNLTGIAIERQAAKTCNFALGYGSSAGNIAYELQIPLNKAEELVKNIKQGLKTFTSWVLETQIKANQWSGIRTLSGRWVPLPDTRHPIQGIRNHALRQAISIKGQGGSGVIITEAMLRLKRKHNIIPILQVHDELLFEVPTDEAESVKKKVIECMENSVKLSIPVKVTAGIGTTWYEAKV